MAEPKPKKPASLREPKPKKFNLRVPPVLQMPHVALFTPDNLATVDEIATDDGLTTAANVQRVPLPVSTVDEIATLDKTAEVEELSAVDNLTTPDNLTSVVALRKYEGYARFEHYIHDHLPAIIGGEAYLVWLRLWRLTYGYGKTEIFISVKRIADHYQWSERTVRRYIQVLEKFGLARRVSVAGRDNKAGNLIQVFLPQTLEDLAGVDKIAGVDKPSAVVKKSDNKKNIKEISKAELRARYQEIIKANPQEFESKIPPGVKVRALEKRCGSLPWNEALAAELFGAKRQG